jgi:hypothetical protein
MMKEDCKGNKSYLPNKPCAACGRLITWRKSWAKNWENVKYCSKSITRMPAADHGALRANVAAILRNLDML